MNERHTDSLTLLLWLLSEVSMTRGTRGSCLMGVDNLMRLLESMVVLTARELLGTIGIISVRLWVYGLWGDEGRLG